MRVEVFDFDLPDGLIALRPASPRDSARLLHVSENGGFTDRVVRDLPALFSRGDVLVVNDTRVIPAKLQGTRRREGAEGARIDINLIERLGAGRWKCLLKPGKKAAPGDMIGFRLPDADDVSALVVEKDQGGAVIEFNLSAAEMDALLGVVGAMPLPPYIAGKRPPDERDDQDYQTLFAAHEGAVAAPTAGLHFTPGLQDRLEEAGVQICRITLHVGAGTFLPVKAEDTDNHKMHPEWGGVSETAAETLNAARKSGRRICCVGTTSLRLVESAACEDGTVLPFSGSTDIFITPGYGFKVADRLLTNFHLPKSTLFMLVSAFSGLDRMKKAYEHAVAEQYRFYSYGDACLLEREEGR